MVVPMLFLYSATRCSVCRLCTANDGLLLLRRRHQSSQSALLLLSVPTGNQRSTTVTNNHHSIVESVKVPLKPSSAYLLFGHPTLLTSLRRCPAKPPLLPPQSVPVHSVGVSVEQHLNSFSTHRLLNSLHPPFHQNPSPLLFQHLCLQQNRKLHVSATITTLQTLGGIPQTVDEQEEKNMLTTEKKFERLPAHIRPQHYELMLEPDLKSLTFSGNVTIHVEVVEETNCIVLNAIDLKIDNVHLYNSMTKQSHKPKSIHPNVTYETIKFEFDDTLKPSSKYTLSLNFNGELNDKMKGLYRSKYVDSKGAETYAAVTQFESTDARRCFPCWDEPALKSTFDITLVVGPKHLVGLSNMPIASQSDCNNGTATKYKFERTPKMSTYLVAVVVGDYDFVQDTSTDGVQVRVYTPKGKKEQGRFALEVATKVLPYYKQYFDIAYPLPKIDLIAIADFSAGAMENWGLVTYRETCLLVDPENTSTVQKQWIALVVGHELAHQWFGNLVTMEWWTHLWLNEGYASFVEYLCVDHLFPEYKIWTQFVNDTYIRALELDSLRNSHPIEVPVGHPSEIDEIFDDISYNKGASVIRMLHNYIGDEDFRNGMNLYLTRHQYGNTFTEDLWAALEEASQKPIGDIMSTWTKQMGFPVIQVAAKEWTDKGVHLFLKQNKYTADGSVPSANYQWMVPISINTSAQRDEPLIKTILKDKEMEVFIPNVKPTTDWIKINSGTVGFYRTQYETKLLDSFLSAIKDRTLPPLDRLGLIDDLFAMVQSGHSNTVEVLKLIEAYIDEPDYTVWSSISNILGKLAMLLSYTDCYDGFRRYQKHVLAKVAKRLGWTPKSGEAHLDTLLRGLVLGRLSWLDDPDTVKEAQMRFENHTNSSQILPADLRSACYKTVLRSGGRDVYEKLLKLYRSADLHEEKDRISRALGAAKSTEILNDVLKFAISEEVRAQDTVFVIISVAVQKAGRDLAWRFFVDNLSLFEDRYKGYLMTRLIKFVCENFASIERANEVEQFFKNHEISGTERTVQQAVETIRLNAAWLKRDTKDIENFLKSY